MTDFQNDMYRRYLASGQAEKAEAFRQAGADQRAPSWRRQKPRCGRRWNCTSTAICA